jgi:hypothetical protein
VRQSKVGFAHAPVIRARGHCSHPARARVWRHSPSSRYLRRSKRSVGSGGYPISFRLSDRSLDRRLAHAHHIGVFGAVSAGWSNAMARS